MLQQDAPSEASTIARSCRPYTQVHDSKQYHVFYPKRIPTAECNTTSPPYAVIVTIYSRISHDPLFRSVQLSPDTSNSVALFEMDHATIPFYVKFFIHRSNYVNTDGSIKSDSDMTVEQIRALQALSDAIASLTNNNVIFHFECCDGCLEDGLRCDVSNRRLILMRFIKCLIDAGFIVMFGNNSFKSLLHDWEASLLGPNPFVQIGECHDSMKLAFDAQQLLSCPSIPLQNIGRLNDGINTVELPCMDCTLVCTLKPEEAYTKGNKHYKLDVLTIATKIDGQYVASNKLLSISDDGSFRGLNHPHMTTPQHRLLQIEEHKGYLGHAILKYRSGGAILVSTGHWIELARLDAVNEEQDIRSHFSCQRLLEEQIQLDNSNQNIIQDSAIHFIQSVSSTLYSFFKHNFGFSL